jgi:pimeloyl-ACP methyl ester carboxylesterase
MKNAISLFVLFFVAILTSFGQDPATPYGNNPEAGALKKINGINLYYETYGSGKPLLFLHGNGGSIKSARNKIEYFKKHFKVIAIDSRGHGKSVDPSPHLTYVQMAKDVAVLLDSLHLDSVYVSGQSDGGILGLLLAINHPKKVSKVVTFGANVFPGKKAIPDILDKMIMDTLRLTKNFQTRRLFELVGQQPNITEKDLQQISCPFLLISGDRDAIRLEHSLTMFYNIKKSNLFIMPGATHFGSVEKPELFNTVVMDFFNKPFEMPSTVEMFTGKK